RLVLADRHGDVFGGFDPTDTTLTTGLPDSRTYDPFGNSTAANGLKYRIGYQGDWTDPRSGDVNQGARWYNPDSGTFNSRDTMTYNAGVASSLPNLYAYGAGNPVTLNDPTGNRVIDPNDDPRCWMEFPNGDDRKPVKRCDPPKTPTPKPGDGGKPPPEDEGACAATPPAGANRMRSAQRTAARSRPKIA
ncbi:RHS repeat-associated core domain-containing protein, partial [Kribbella catacumbae]|uniref:RHS repeat-associated core domain-containing protein n=1 Tax=Kribbella catacumbae TaxID=460086 RepID=UPI000590DC5E